MFEDLIFNNKISRSKSVLELTNCFKCDKETDTGHIVIDEEYYILYCTECAIAELFGEGW